MTISDQILTCAAIYTRDPRLAIVRTMAAVSRKSRLPTDAIANDELMATIGDSALALRIVEAGHPVLRNGTQLLGTSQLRSPRFSDLIDLMRVTLRAAPGVGLAAPQVGLPLRMAIVEDRAEYQQSLSRAELRARGRRPIPFHVLVNPQLTVVDAEPALFSEGCLSVPGYSAQVARARVVRVQALDHRGRPVSIVAEGWYARILQHEVDHLDGRLYVDRMDSRTFLSSRELGRTATTGKRGGNR